MLPSAIVFFRELFEIVLIVGIILAATRSLAGRKKWIVAGIGAGLFGSALIAVFANTISEFADGVGQELFNGSVLLVAALFIGWTVLWMSKHARHMKSQFTSLGERIREGNAHFVSLSVIIALAIWREGSEIVLFSYGMMAAGQPFINIAMGGVVGGSLGLAIGYATYRGLISLPYRYYLRVTTGLLVLLVAGMLSQSLQFFIAAGYVETFTQRAWDSSWLVSDGSALAQALHALIGYTATPSIVQVLVYFLTLGLFMMYLNFSKIKNLCHRNPQATIAAIVTLALCASMPSEGVAGSKVYSPYVEKGELELEWKGAYNVDDDNAIDGAMKNKFAIGYAFTDYWYTEVIGELEKDGASGADQEWTALEWENRFQLTQAGEYFVDMGAYAAYEVSLESHHADKAEMGLLLAKDTGLFTHYANIFLEKEVGGNTQNDTEAAFAWSTRYRYKEWLEPGFEVHSEFGELNKHHSYDEQEHLVGPVIYGKVGHFKYDVGYLFGASDAASDGQLKWVLEYEMKF